MHNTFGEWGIFWKLKGFTYIELDEYFLDKHAWMPKWRDITFIRPSMHQTSSMNQIYFMECEHIDVLVWTT